jgi:mannose-6-phosphate isomerase-like protein (cupin superfamily)
MQGEQATRVRRAAAIRTTATGKRSRLQRLIAGVRTRAACPVGGAEGPARDVVRLDGESLGTDGSHGGSEGVCGGVYLTSLTPGGVSAWHFPRVREEHLFVASGRVRIVLYDARAGSRTTSTLNQFCVGGRDRQVIVVPPGVCYGFRNEGDADAVIVTMPIAREGDEPGDPCRMAAPLPEIPFDWHSGDVG